MSKFDYGQLSAHRDVVLPVNSRKSSNVHFLTDEHTMRRSAEMKHAQFVTFLQEPALGHSDLTSADLIHANAHKRHETYCRVIGLDKDDCTCGQRCEISLGYRESARVDVDDAVGQLALVLVSAWPPLGTIPSRLNVSSSA